MDYLDAIEEVLEEASGIKLPGHRLDVVTIARREFSKRGTCDIRYIDPIEETIGECIRRWSAAQKREIWESTETGMQSDVGSDAYTPDSIDMDLEGELMYHLIERLSPARKRNEPERDGHDLFD
jgi:hypothetical protein